MIQLIVHYIKENTTVYYEEENGEMKKVEKLSESEDKPYEWYFYNDVAEERFLSKEDILSAYIYEEIEGIPAENIGRIHENVYLKQKL